MVRVVPEELPSLRDSLYGETTRELRQWIAAYVRRNADDLALMARL